MTNKPAHSASEYAASYPAALETVRNRDIIITNALLIDKDNFGKPAYVFSYVDRETGETAKIRGNQELIRGSIEKMIEAKAFPVMAHFYKEGKPWLVRGWDDEGDEQ